MNAIPVRSFGADVDSRQAASGNASAVAVRARDFNRASISLDFALDAAQFSAT